MPEKVTLEFDKEKRELIILDETGGKQLGRLPVPTVFEYPTKEEV